MKHILFNIAFTLALTLLSLHTNVPTAHADQFKIAAARSTVHESIRPIIQNFDAEATYVLELPAKFVVKELPGTPFTFENLEIRETSGELVFGEATLNVYTKKSALPSYIEDALGKAFSSHGIKNKVNLVNIPYAEAEGFWSRLSSAAFRPESLPFVFSAFLLYALLFGGYVMRWKQSSSVSQSLTDGMNKLASALSEKATQPIAQESSEREAKKDAREFNSDSALNDRQLFASLNQNGILELLADCYWSEADSYAAYIWPRVPASVREALTQQHEWLAQYGRAISRLPEENLGHHHDPYYLKPLPLHKLSNQDLLAHTQKNLGLYNTLPTLRSEQVALNAKMRLQALNKAALSNLEAEKLVAVVKPSKLRDLNISQVITVQSVQEEEELLSLTNLEPQQKSMIQTMIWAKDIDSSKLSSILSEFSAQNLAQAWVGPKSTLELLASAIPEKKRKLTLSYIEQVKPSRKSAAYKSLCQAILSEVKKQHESSDYEQPKKAS